MSIDWLFDRQRDLENGKIIYACPGAARSQWDMSYRIEDLLPIAQRAANLKKIPVDIVQLILPSDAVAGDLFLCPTEIGDPGPRGEPSIKWSTVDTREAADMMKDVRQGTSPIFATQKIQTVEPDA
ncbi:MAG: hypothetical protein KDD62_08500 [Bdellovibrionales bacterium]|nr:hypothetical protein [Bdellovibrionales bacterium]